MLSQTFSGGAHVRDPTQKLEDVLQNPAARFLLATERKVYTFQKKEGSTSEVDQGLLWLDLAALCSLLHVRQAEGGLVSERDKTRNVAVYLLGMIPESGRLALAVDVSEQLAETNCSLNVAQFIDLRVLLSSLPPSELALAGHAVALSQWHQAHRFCPRCGQPTAAVDCGTKRQCPAKHRLYPRTDPVVIMLIESCDGQRALMGRSKNVPKDILTCLSGFVDQAESVEEAVARECMEEAGVAIDSVQIVGSQPWPIGRAGSCELMLGCVGRAVCDDLKVNTVEMDECRWVTRQELSEAIQRSKTVKFNMSDKPSPSPSSTVFSVPPAWAIAHHLMLYWINKQPSSCSTQASAKTADKR